MSLFVLLVGGLMQSCASENQTFVPLCIASQCAAEAEALGGDAYTKSLASCTAENFGPCASKAWDCLGDASCRQVLTCAPEVFGTCKADIWKMLTDPVEREKVMCLESCVKDGKIQKLCVVEKCGSAAVHCLLDKTCRDAALCLPKASLACSKPAFKCIFGMDKECHENLQCLAHGVATCGGPAINLMTDSKIADFVACAGSKCPHPGRGFKNLPALQAVTGAEPTGTAHQLLCMAEKCSSKSLKILEDQATRDLLTCAISDPELPKLCHSAWECLGDATCASDLSCIVKPFESCKDSLWHMLTTQVERQRIEQTAKCLHDCEQAHAGDFLAASFCVLDSCSQGILDCYRDSTCREAVKCLPSTAGQCAIPMLDAYAHQALFRNTTKCLGRGLESCGRAAVAMLQDPDIAEAVQCASQCTITPRATSTSTFVV